MPVTPTSPPSECSQYHHYIPQFILRNFTHRYRPPITNSRGRPQPNRGKSRKKDKLYPGDQALHLIDVSKDVPELIESPIRRTFGLTDMYRDVSRDSRQHYLEELLSKLESRASVIITKIRKDFESGQSGVWISRSDRNVLRKFLFIMKYRGKGFHKRFVGDETRGYVADDKGIFLKYMREKGFEKPLDVWFHSVKVIIELDMDLKGDWMASLVDHIYPEDAHWFIMHTQMMYLAICTPSSADTEFVLTENCYNVFEGPNTILEDPTDETMSGPWTSYHEFSPIAPKLLMILRSCLLPSPEEDANANIKEWRENWYRLNINQHLDPSRAGSKLADLPIRKARNSYTSLGTQGVTLLAGEDGSQRSYHQFWFEFFQISAEHVHKINMIMLENAQDCQVIAFTSQNALKITIEHYLTFPVDQGFKHVSNKTSDSKLLYLQKLEHILKQLGSHERLVYHLKNVNPVDIESLRVMEENMVKHLPEQPTAFMQLYMKLGGSGATMFEDMDQARRMVKLRIKIDVCSQGLDESKRNDIRGIVRDLFCQLPARRLWYYLKHLRLMQTNGRSGRLLDVSDGSLEQMDGPEDVIVKASHVIQPEKVGRLMYFSVTQQLFLLRNFDIDKSANTNQSVASPGWLGRAIPFCFGQVGSVCDCGLDSIQEKSRLITNVLRATQADMKQKNVFWTKSQMVEMRTRVYVREDMEKLLGNRLQCEVLQELKDVIFNLIYPTYTETGR